MSCVLSRTKRVTDVDMHVLSRNLRSVRLQPILRVVDLGNLGGQGLFNGHLAHAINSNDEIVGSSDLKGDEVTHAFRWTRIGGIEDLGTLDGDALSIA